VSEAPSEAFGPYLVYEQLGAGGMAQVHRAEVIGEGFHRPVALKRMLPHVAGNLDMVKAFVREAHLASQLRHANVAQTYELGKVDDTYFIAMELIRGRNLREILRQCYATTGSPMPVPVALNILNQICDALDYAHNLCDERGQPLGIIHRDVSPSNVIVAEGGVVKLIDFGIAKVSAAGMQTMSGTLKGKFGYMAPEYIDGSIDARADLFAVGVIAHELLTNRPLFSTHDDMETLCRVREMEVSPPSRRNPQVPAAVDDIVMTALARDPDRRWQHATALRNAMTTVTARCGLVVTNAKAHEWLDWLFDQTNPHSIAAPQGLTLDDGEPSIMVEHPDASGNITRIADSEPPTTALPAGTPSRMSAQASIPPPLASESQHEYRAAVARYERHDALVPTGSMLAEDVMPTSIRSSAPRIQPRGPQDINQTIAGTVPARQTPPRTLEARNAPITVDPPLRPSAPRVQAPSDPAFVAPGSGTRAPTEAIQPARNGSFAVTVILVLLAAGLAAGAVYFLLPLVT
jgi:serine/threonine protein kinase